MEITPNKHRISKYFRLPAMNQTERQAEFMLEDKLWKNTIPVHNDQYIFGIEVEAENCDNINPKAMHKAYWNMTADNSLRNNGVEFVSVPLRSTQIEPALSQLQTWFTPEVTFSPRTSVHVHMNVRDLTIDQITNLIFVYTSVEDVLFKWVGHGRDNNVFCTKITETDYVRNFIQFLSDPHVVATNYWNKYTAFNLVPIQDKGTVEFRHLYGTADIPTIVMWVNFLSMLKTYAKNNTTQQIVSTIQELNSNSQYELYLQSIFQEYTHHLGVKPQEIQSLLENAVSYVKLAIIATKKEPEYHILDEIWTPPIPPADITTIRLNTPRHDFGATLAQMQRDAAHIVFDPVLNQYMAGTAATTPAPPVTTTREQQEEAEARWYRLATQPRGAN